MDGSLSCFQNPICSFSPWLILGASPWMASPLLWVSTKFTTCPHPPPPSCPISARTPHQILSAVLIFLLSEPMAATIPESLVAAFVSLLNISKVLSCLLSWKLSSAWGQSLTLSPSRWSMNISSLMKDWRQPSGVNWMWPALRHREAEEVLMT